MRSKRTKRAGQRKYLYGLSARLAVLFCCSANRLSFAQELPSLDVIAGKALFEKNWVSAPASTAASDGLGPYFNARSCAACHDEGGRGDATERLSFVTADPVYGAFLQTRAVQGLRAEGQVRVAFQTRAARLPDGTEIVLHVPQYEAHDLQYGALSQQLSARVAPSLRGLALLEQIPEQYLESLADPDDSNGDGISGRMSKVAQGSTGEVATGRFGWKAEAASLKVQVARAFSLDMGLGTVLFPSAFGDCTDRQPDCLHQASGNSPEAADPEVSGTVLELLLTYLQSLAPVEYLTDPVTAGSRQSDAGRYAAGSEPDADSGEYADAAGPELFNKVGCNTCHTPSIPADTRLISPFTDLLLHDMGPGLSAEPTGSATATEWRTAPLWGLSAVGSYLHDGRATSLPEAIMWHGGEATSAVTAYSELNAAEREVLHTWLHSL